MSRKTRNLFQIVAPEKSFSLKKMDYTQRDTLEFTAGGTSLSGTQVTGERIEGEEVIWALQDSESGRLYILGTQQA